MDDPSRVGLAEGPRELAAERDGLGDPQGAAREAFAERPPREEGHDEVAPEAGLAGVEERDEALGLAERRREAALAVEAPGADRLALHVVVRAAAAEELDRDGGAVGGARARDEARAALPDHVEDLVGSDTHGPAL